MEKPEGVECRHCENWWWYAGSCSAYSYDEDLGIDPMMPESIEFCDRFELKHTSEDDWYDPLPPREIVELCRKIYNDMCDSLSTSQQSCISKGLERPDFKELRRLAKDSPVLLDWVGEYQKLWENHSSEESVKNEIR